MRLNECTVFSYVPEHDPFEEDESAIWAVHYFFFNRLLKRVAYLYVRVVPVVSSQSPTLLPMRQSEAKRTVGIDLESLNAGKRASYWLGDARAELITPPEDEDDQYEEGIYWSRDEDGDLVPWSDEEYVEELQDDLDDTIMDKPLERYATASEDVVGRMEI